MKYLYISGLLLFITICLGAKNKMHVESVNLQKLGPHYVFTSDINGASDVKVLLESGIPAMLADSAFVFSTGVLSTLDLSPVSNEKINLGGRTYTITHKASGAVKIGDHISYRGDVFILSDYATHYELAIPLQYICNDRGTRIVRLVLEDNSLQILSRSDLRSRRGAYIKHRMTTKTYLGMPAVMTELTIDYGKGTGVLKGKFIIDFGNPELVFLMHQHEEVQKFISENPDIELKSARNQRGDVVAQFIIAEQCKLCKSEFYDAVVAITRNLPKFTAVGNIGLKYFKPLDVIFDFDRNIMYISPYGI